MYSTNKFRSYNVAKTFSSNSKVISFLSLPLAQYSAYLSFKVASKFGCFGSQPNFAIAFALEA